LVQAANDYAADRAIKVLPFCFYEGMVSETSADSHLPTNMPAKVFRAVSDNQFFSGCPSAVHCLYSSVQDAVKRQGEHAPFFLYVRLSLPLR
jgi:hypothetical protein